MDGIKARPKTTNPESLINSNELLKNKLAEPKDMPPKKSKGFFLKFIIVGLLIIFLSGLGVFSWGYYNSYSIKKYLNDAENMINETKKWEGYFSGEITEEEVEDVFKKINNQSNDFISKLNNKKAPIKARELEKNLVEYFTLSSKNASEMEKIALWAVEFNKALESLQGFGEDNDLGSDEEFLLKFKNDLENLNKAIEKLKNINLPDAMKGDHEKFVDYLTDVAKLYEKMIKAIEVGDMDSLISLQVGFATLMDKFNDFNSPEDVIEKSFGKDISRLEELEKKIENQVREFKSIGMFVF